MAAKGDRVSNVLKWVCLRSPSGASRYSDGQRRSLTRGLALNRVLLSNSIFGCSEDIRDSYSPGSAVRREARDRLLPDRPGRFVRRATSQEFILSRYGLVLVASTRTVAVAHEYPVEP